MKKIATALIAVMLVTLLAPCALADAPRFDGVTLTVFNWYDYIDPNVIGLFE